MQRIVLFNRVIPRELDVHASTIEEAIERENGIMGYAVRRHALVHDNFRVAQMEYFGEVAFYDDVGLEDQEGGMSASWFVVKGVGDLVCVLYARHGRGGVQASYAPNVAQSISVKIRKCWLQRRTRATAGVESFSKERVKAGCR